jgi:hypothetical protein
VEIIKHYRGDTFRAVYALRYVFSPLLRYFGERVGAVGLKPPPFRAEAGGFIASLRWTLSPRAVGSESRIRAYSEYLDRIRFQCESAQRQ